MGVLLGYKHFFTPKLGLRYHNNINFNLLYTNRKLQTNVLNIGGNLEFLGNFIDNNNLSFGGFVGLGIGGMTWYDTNQINMDFALNLGLRTNIATHHGAELAIRIPFKSNKLMNTKNNDIAITHRYNVMVRYIASF